MSEKMCVYLINLNLYSCPLKIYHDNFLVISHKIGLSSIKNYFYQKLKFSKILKLWVLSANNAPFNLRFWSPFGRQQPPF